MKWVMLQAPENGCLSLLNNMTAFLCNQCGLCCQNVHLAAETHFLDRGDGTCRHYDDTSKLCLVYNSRPDICRVDLQYKLHYVRIYSWDEFVTLNVQVCQQLAAKQEN